MCWHSRGCTLGEMIMDAVLWLLSFFAALHKIKFAKLKSKKNLAAIKRKTKQPRAQYAPGPVNSGVHCSWIRNDSACIFGRLVSMSSTRAFHLSVRRHIVLLDLVQYVPCFLLLHLISFRVFIHVAQTYYFIILY